MSEEKRRFKRFGEQSKGLPRSRNRSRSRFSSLPACPAYGESHDREREQKDNECSLRARRRIYSALRDFSRSRDSPWSKSTKQHGASRLLRGSFVQLFLRDENVKNFAIEKLMRKFFTFHVFSLGQRKLRVFAADRLSRVGLREFGRSSCESAHVRANSCMLGLPRRLAREPFAAVAVVVIHSPGQFVERSSLRTGGRVRECRCVITWE